MNVQTYIRSGCDTGGMAGLSRQIAYTLFQSLPPTAIINISDHVQIIGLGKLPYLQKAAGDALIAAIAEKGEKPKLIHALRVINQQVAVSEWYKHKRCGIPLAANPGTSPHEKAVAIDIQEHDRWLKVLTKHGWRWRGNADPGHYTWIGAQDPEFGHYSIKAFQHLYNLHNAVHLVEDGNYGALTEAAVLASPTEGWA